MWIWLILASALLLGLYDIAKKQALKKNSVLYVLLLATAFSTLILIPFMEAGTGNDHLRLVLKAVLVTTSWVSGLVGIKMLPLTTASTIKASRPVFVLIFSLILFGERLNWMQWVGILVAFVALYMLSRSSKKEGIDFKLLNNPVEILGDENGWVKGMRCIKMELGEPDESGRRRPVPVEGSEFDLDVDTVIVSIGTGPNPIIAHTTPGLDTTKRGNIVADEETCATSKEGVFAGGDIVTGAATVILAMGAGRKAAASIDEYLTKKRG